MLGYRHLVGAFGEAAEIPQRVTIDVFAVDGARSNLFISGRRRDVPSFFSAASEIAITIASGLMGILGGGLGTGPSGDEDPLLALRSLRQDDHLIVVNTSPLTSAFPRRQRGGLPPEAQHHTLPSWLQILTCRVVPTGVNNARVDVVHLRFGEPG